MLTHRTASSRFAITFALGTTVVGLAGCRIPWPREDRAAAVGTVTISTPRFTPIIPGDDRATLDFGKLKEVGSLWDMVSKANMSGESISVESTELALKGEFAGPAIDNKSTRTVTSADGKVTADTQTQTDTTTQKTPVFTSAGSAPTAGDAQAKLVALLAAGPFQPTLTPDQKATLVASYSAYFNSLENFSRIGQDLSTSANPDDIWLPYTVQFRVVADPGWRSLTRDRDAVADIYFGDMNDVRVISVMPSETAQIMEDMQASMRSFALALALSGSYESVGAAFDFKRFEALAERLEGQRLNTSLIVTYPQPGRIRIRFRPSLSAERGNAHDLQPTSKLITAIVQVRNAKSETPKAPKDASGTKKPKDPAEPPKAVGGEPLPPATTGNVGPRLLADPTALTGAPAIKPECGHPVAANEVGSREMSIIVNALFTPAARDTRDGGSRQPGILTNTIYPNDATKDRPGLNNWHGHGEFKGLPIQTIIPAWAPPAYPRLAITHLSGTYQPGTSSDFATVAIAYELHIADKDVASIGVSVAGVHDRQPDNSGVFEGSKAGGVWTATAAKGKVDQARSGFFTLNVPTPAKGTKSISIPLQFTVTPPPVCGKAATPTSVFQVVTIPTVSGGGPAAATPVADAGASVQVRGLNVEEVHLKLSPSPTTTPSATTQPAGVTIEAAPQGNAKPSP